jgi:hypothetical protein
MGADVTTGRKASAFRAIDGTIMYCLYESTYSKNCFPHTPSWDCYYVGKIEGAMRQIFRFASSCEGGMLQNKSGRLTPEGYLRTWMQELKQPHIVERDHQVDLYYKEGGWSAPISDSEHLLRVTTYLSELGHQEWVESLTRGEKITLSLFQDAILIADMHDKGFLRGSRILANYTHPHESTHRDPALGFLAPKIKIASPVYPPALVISKKNGLDYTLLQQDDGTWRSEGAPYRIVSSYIANLWETELRTPGNYQALITGFRDHLKAARLLRPEGVTVVADRRLADDKYGAKNIDEVSALPGASSNGDLVTIPFAEELEWQLCNLPHAATKWHVPQQTASGEPTQTCFAL